MRTRLAPRRGTAPAGDAAVALIDAELAAGAHRHCFTVREAREVLERVRATVDDSESRPAVASIMDDALASLGDDELIERWRLLDPLLDIRRVLHA